MEREIKFRGQSVKSGKWYYGHLCKERVRGNDKDESIYVIIEYAETVRIGLNEYMKADENRKSVVVKNDTVGQFTGLVDKHGKEIFEGDIVAVPINKMARDVVLEVYFDGAFYAKGYYFGEKEDLLKKVISQFGVKIIGNIHDNPELLEDNRHV